VRFAAAVGATLLLAGCAAAEPLDPDTVAIVPPQQTGMDALLVGALELGEDCVTVVTPEGEVLPIFPATLVAWEGDSLVIDGRAHIDGAPVWLGGGFIREGSDGRPLPGDAHVPEGCPTGTVFLVAG